MTDQHKSRGGHQRPNSSNDDSTSSYPERVYRIVRQIPPGSVTTYGTIAAVLGDRRGARMVGWAMSKCPEDVSDVAHRVVNRYGELSGGWAWGHPEIMKQLLVEEGVTFAAEYQVDLARHLWIPPIEPDVADEWAGREGPE
ncbi:MAG: MGMT family protein [Vicinamibacterales bacterium]